MTLQQFCATSQYVQRSMIRHHGVFLMKRETESTYAYLFQVDVFYVEVFFNETTGNILHIKPFENIDQLEPYLQELDISEVVEKID